MNTSLMGLNQMGGGTKADRSYMEMDNNMDNSLIGVGQDMGDMNLQGDKQDDGIMELDNSQIMMNQNVFDKGVIDG